MAEYRLSSRAEGDLGAIADYTIDNFGVEQARRYGDEFEKCFERLAENPRQGRSAEHLASGLRRFEHRSHIVFYAEDEPGILIVRILHASMDVSRHV